MDVAGDQNEDWSNDQMNKTRKIVIDAIQDDDLELGGLALHRFADLYAHRYRHNGTWFAYGGKWGHARHKHKPDQIYEAVHDNNTNPHSNTANFTEYGGKLTIDAYIEDASLTIAKGFISKKAWGRAPAIATEAKNAFLDVYNNTSKSKGDFFARARDYEFSDYQEGWKLRNMAAGKTRDGYLASVRHDANSITATYQGQEHRTAYDKLIKALGYKR